jgi:peptide-N-glycosidase F-like protein/type IX secretion system substrate protein
MAKKYLYSLAIVLFASLNAQAAPGDTTWVQANVAKLQGYGNYDSVVQFPAPGKTYRAIYMIFTLGKYMCPGYDPANAAATGWCGDWDYTVQNYLLTPDNITLELGRLITPYANALNPRTPWTALQHYVYDVTDYAGVLHDTAKMRIAFSGYSGGFTANIKFAFIEGVPDRDVLGIRQLWGGSHGYGGVPSINVNFPNMSGIAPAFTKDAKLKFTVTGHGSDGNGCCEFMAHNYQVMLNGATIADTKIWRDNCGANELYPQSGTWIYQRGNWCPGAMVYPNYHDLPGVSAGQNYTVGLQFDPYSGGGSYTTEGTLFFYGGMKKTLDASIDQIIAPNNSDVFFRENPVCGSPVIRVKNRGIAAIDSISFQYGLTDTTTQTYTWVGHLNTFDEADVNLAALAKLSVNAVDTGMYNFKVKILTVNGAPDADATNNTMSTQFVKAPLWPSSFKISFATNNEAIATGSNISETSWIIYDMSGKIVKQRANVNISTTYNDTISLPTGCYRLQIYDSSCDGLSWWGFQGTGTTDGSFFVRKLGGSAATIPMNGYNYSGTYAHDFGCGFTQYFSINTPDHTGVTNIIEEYPAMTAYPNPAQGVVTVEISGTQQVKGQLHLIDALGRVVSVTQCNSGEQQIDLQGLASGVYTIVFFNQVSGNKLSTRLLITK